MEPMNSAGQKRPLPDWNQLKFEFTPTDSMFIAEIETADRWNEGKICPLQDLRVSPAAAVFNYGQAVFEGLKAIRTLRDTVVLFRPEENARRFSRSAARLVMPPYPVDWFVHAVEELVRAEARWIPPA